VDSTDFPPHRVGRIAASLDLDPEASDQILATNGIDEQQWDQLEDHWDDVVVVELEANSTTTLDAMDDGYVERIEGERGPIDAPTYEQIRAAADRGNLETVLDELDIPHAAHMRIVRVLEGRLRRSQ